MKATKNSPDKYYSEKAKCWMYKTWGDNGMVYCSVPGDDTPPPNYDRWVDASDFER